MGGFMFEGLGRQLGRVFDRLRGRGVLSEEDVTSALREIRIALLEADVALPFVKDFISSVKERAIGEKLIASINPGQLITKIVHDQLVAALSHPDSAITIAPPAPQVILMAGLQGSGKTTMSAKLAHLLKNRGKMPLLASLDVYRPAAQMQLEKLGIATGIETVEIVPGQKPLEIATRALAQAKACQSDVVILDTAGRLHIDEELMAELVALKKKTAPREILFVADALSGQDAVRTAEAFHVAVGITGICLSRIDGDGRGGAILSIRSVTGCPVKLLGTGERPDQVELFNPERIASRILDMGDIVALVEQASALPQEDAERAFTRIKKGIFTLDDLAKQIQGLEKMGGIKSFLGWLPGIRQLKERLGDQIDTLSMKRQLAIIRSMTPKERARPDILDGSRKQRIAHGSGTTIQDVNKLLRQFKQMKDMMKVMGKQRDIRQ